ncbi:MAG: sensor histidine kinase [Methylobacter sp.]
MLLITATLGGAVCYLSGNQTIALSEQFTQYLPLAGALICVPVLVLIILVNRLFAKPIKELTEMVLTVKEADDLSSRIPVSDGKEIADLGHAINRMTARLANRFHGMQAEKSEWENQYQNLERMLAERSAQLQEALMKAHLTQAQLEHMDRSASLGRLTAGIANEIQAVIDSATIPALEQQAADRIRNIVLAMGNLSCPDQAAKTVQIERGLDSVLQVLHHIYKDRINIEKDYTLNAPVECDAGEMNQVFLNILVNAIEAIPGKGSIMITTAKMNDRAVVSIADTGVGMTDDVKDKIFEPFFTAKNNGSAIGLGLSVARNIVEKHHGMLTVESEPNRGARFIVAVPLRFIKNA